MVELIRLAVVELYRSRLAVMDLYRSQLDMQLQVNNQVVKSVALDLWPKTYLQSSLKS